MPELSMHTVLVTSLTKAWSKYVDDSFWSIWEKEGPVEAEDNNNQQNWYDDFVHWLYRSHAPADRETGQ